MKLFSKEFLARSDDFVFNDHLPFIGRSHCDKTLRYELLDSHKMPVSRLDVVYRKFLLTKFFTKGWGSPEKLIRYLLCNLHVLSKQHV